MNKQKTKSLKSIPVMISVSLNSKIQHQTVEQGQAILDSIKGQSEKTIEERENECQGNMDSISNEMAVFFSERIAASDFSRWLFLVCKNIKDLEGAENFSWEFCYSFLPEFIKCGNDAEKISFLRTGLIETFDSIGERQLFETMSLIGINLAKEFKTDRSDAQCVRDHMEPYVTLMCVCEMYNEYVCFRQLLEQKGREAA